MMFGSVFVSGDIVAHVLWKGEWVIAGVIDVSVYDAPYRLVPYNQEAKEYVESTMRGHPRRWQDIWVSERDIRLVVVADMIEAARWRQQKEHRS